jgi:hypothetical protein
MNSDELGTGPTEADLILHLIGNIIDAAGCTDDVKTFSITGGAESQAGIRDYSATVTMYNTENNYGQNEDETLLTVALMEMLLSDLTLDLALSWRVLLRFDVELVDKEVEDTNGLFRS